MKKRTSLKRRTIKHHRKRKLHHRIISHFRGNGGIYVVLILGVVMAGSFALTGGIMPNLNPNPLASSKVDIDEASADESSETSLQLVDIKIKPTATPTPIPTVIPTTPPVSCLDKTVITLLLDVSTSMNSNNKIGTLNSVMNKFVDNLRDETVVGAVQFAGLASFPSPQGGAATILPYTKYKDNKNLVSNTLTNLRIRTDSSNDGTYFRSAFTRGIANIDAAKSKYTGEGYNKFVTIVVTDGVPETQFTDNNCRVEFQNPYLCFANVQDPRNTNANSVDLTDRMKEKVEKVYAVGIYTGARERQALSQARTLLQDIASEDSYAKSSTEANDLEKLFNDSVNSVCN